MIIMIVVQDFRFYSFIYSQPDHQRYVRYEKTDSEIYESQNGIYISPDCIDEVYIQILGNDKLNKSNN